MTTNNERLHRIENRLKKLSGLRLDYRSHGENSLGAGDFNEWLEKSENLNDIDMMRNALYYGFQPLYDALVINEIDGPRREAGLYALDKINLMGIKFLTGYYLGEPDPKVFLDGIKEAGTYMKCLDGTRYKTKFRNVDYNSIYPNDIVSFISQFLEYCLDGKMKIPDYVIGCACGSSEIVMPLAGIIETDLGFIRRSWRRGDDNPRIINEQEETLRNHIENNTIICVEDYVCSGRSLRKVMEFARKYKPECLRGVSVNGNSDENLDILASKSKFHMYRLGG